MRDEGGFAASRWFSRGWTLQELIAPKVLIFLSSDWCEIGTKETMALDIERTTGIGRIIIQNAEHIHGVSVAKRMSWASNRETTREEDIAYRLLGIFNVNMPLLYGEGRKTFVRLQEEIMKDSTDQSLFAWSMPIESLSSQRLPKDEASGVLARHPRYFETASNIVPYQVDMKPYTMTNKGLHIRLPVFYREKRHVAILSCHVGGNFFGPISILLESVEGEGAGVFVRSLAKPEVVDDSERKISKFMSIYILKEKRITVSRPKYAWVRSIPLPAYGFQLDMLDLSKHSSSPDSWDIPARTMLLSHSLGWYSGRVILKHKEHPWVVIDFGIFSGFVARLFVDISVPNEFDNLDDKPISNMSLPNKFYGNKPIGDSWNGLLLRPPNLRSRIDPLHGVLFLRPQAQTAYTDIIPGKKVRATISTQRIMDSELLVLDIEASYSTL